MKVHCISISHDECLLAAKCVVSGALSNALERCGPSDMFSVQFASWFTDRRAIASCGYRCAESQSSPNTFSHRWEIVPHHRNLSCFEESCRTRSNMAYGTVPWCQNWPRCPPFVISIDRSSLIALNLILLLWVYTPHGKLAWTEAMKSEIAQFSAASLGVVRYLKSNLFFCSSSKDLSNTCNTCR